MKHELRKNIGGFGICLGVLAACIAILLLSVLLGTANGSIAPVFGAAVLILLDISMMVTIVKKYAPAYEEMGGSKKEFGSYAASGYWLSMLATVIMALKGWYISGYVEPDSTGSKFVNFIRDLAHTFGEVFVFWSFCAIHLILLLIAAISIKNKTKE